MYIVSQPKPPSEDRIQALTTVDAISFPPGYLRFLRRFGEGTYRGWMNVQLPDTEVLKPFAEYDLWEHDADSPITQQQIGECIAIGTTVDGDFLAVHPQTAQLLWLPRHDEYLKAVSLQERKQHSCGACAGDSSWRRAAMAPSSRTPGSRTSRGRPSRRSRGRWRCAANGARARR